MNRSALAAHDAAALQVPAQSCYCCSHCSLPPHSTPLLPTTAQIKQEIIPKKMGLLTAAAIATVSAGGAVVAAPVILGVVGFGSAGIAASSYAAAWMSSAAIANGGGVAAGSLFAVLQSAGMAGLSTAATAAVAGTGGTVGGLVAAVLI
nr:interferon alpha-inducible protein 27-like protein 2A [Solea senegalensis]